MAILIFTKFGWYDVGPILRPYLEGGHYWSMWACLSTTNPNRHTFSLLHFHCTSHYSEHHGSDIGLCPYFCPEPVILGANFLVFCGTLGPSCSSSYFFFLCPKWSKILNSGLKMNIYITLSVKYYIISLNKKKDVPEKCNKFPII